MVTYLTAPNYSLTDLDNMSFAHVHVVRSHSDKIATGSFDKTACLWSALNGTALRAFQGHTAEVVSAEFSHSTRLLASASMDGTARIFDIESGVELQTFGQHTDAVIAARLSRSENLLLTGSFDAIAYIWDLRTDK